MDGSQGRKRSAERRTALSLLVLVLAVGLACGPTPASSTASAHVPPAAERPNILIILTDDQRLAGTMFVLDHVRRWFGHGGRTFRRMFDNTPLCCPSRVTMLTGLLAHNHGIHDNEPSGIQVFDESATIQRYLQEAGYYTGFYGKLFNFWRVEHDPSYFDRWGVYHPTNRWNGYLDMTWNLQGRMRQITRYSTDFIATKGVRFIEAAEARDDDPWFLELAPFAPHLVAVAAPRHENAPVGSFHQTPAMRERDRSDKPPSIRGDDTSSVSGGLARLRQLRALMAVDDLVAKIARALRRTDESRETLAIFLSDNGFLWGEHGVRAKGYPYLEGVQVPLLMRWPQHIERGSNDRRLAVMADIAPTILDAAGVEQDPMLPMDGRSLLDRTWRRNRVLMEYWHWNGSSAPPWASLMGRTYQYTEYYRNDGTILFREYYDLKRDPWQLVNLLHDGRPRNDPDTAALHERLTTDRSCEGTACP